MLQNKVQLFTKYFIRIEFGNNVGVGKGDHDILLTYDHLNTTAEASCPTVKKPTVKIDIS